MHVSSGCYLIQKYLFQDDGFDIRFGMRVKPDGSLVGIGFFTQEKINPSKRRGWANVMKERIIARGFPNGDDIDELLKRQEKRLEKAYEENDRVQVILAEDSIELLEYLKTLDKGAKRHFVDSDEQFARVQDIRELTKRRTNKQWRKDWAARRL